MVDWFQGENNMAKEPEWKKGALSMVAWKQEEMGGSGKGDTPFQVTAQWAASSSQTPPPNNPFSCWI